MLIPLVMALAFTGLFAGSALAAYDCSNGAADPPFLAAGVPPNLLLLIDNSGSMYDMAYTGDDNSCYDGTDMAAGTESYDPTKVYGGYFKTDAWYKYNTGAVRFEAISTPASCPDPTDGAAYADDTANPTEICTTIAGATVTFKARGNFMNWATASKFDIQKQVLTGGKFDSGANTLTSEGRGCSGNRYIKQIGVLDSSGAQYYLTLGTHPVSAFDEDSPDPTTAIDLFQINQTGFDNSACSQAVEEMADPMTSLGTLKGLIDECMEYANNQTYTTADGPAFNQAVQSCWWWDTHDDYETGDRTQHAISIQNHCETLYASQDPESITPESPGYVCYGKFDGTDDTTNTGTGYVGSCWVPEEIISGSGETCTTITCDLAAGTYTSGSMSGDALIEGDRCTGGIVEYCSGNYNANQDSCNKAWLAKEECSDDPTAIIIPAHWVADATNCVSEALYRFCQGLELPEVVDPSDQTTATGEVYNLPAMLTDTGVSGQLGDPLLTMQSVIYDAAWAADSPSGLLHEFASDIRMGVMKFNYDGAQAECALRDADAAANPTLTRILYECDGTTDGGNVVTEIADGTTAHINAMVTAINAIEADSWTPLAEAVYNAIGYYTQRNDMRLNTADFTIDAATAPCTDWCQSNNILVITEGASTADLNTDVTTFAAVSGQSDDDGDTTAKCNDLYGSTYLDDITYYGYHGTNIHLEASYDAEEHFQNIKTYFVVAGTPRTSGTGECSPATMMDDAAANGGTDAPYYADNPEDLNEELKTVFNVIRAGAAAGSAASVISATRGGEGAIYQAIFWPSIDGPMVNGEPKHKVTWTGEVHSLLVDAYGKMFEDTDGDYALSSSDEQVVLYYDTDARESKACDQDLELDGTCAGNAKSLHEVNYLWSTGEWLAGISDTDINTNRASFLASTQQRYIFTWDDLDNDGVVDSGEQLPFTIRSDWGTAALAVSGDRAPVPIDFGVTTTDEVNRIISWVRGLDDLSDNTLRPRELNTPTNFDLPGSPATITWRLGDVVHSTPTAVSRPSEGYHQLYQDDEYAAFYDAYQHRRHVIYFGGNDGMVHAINAGFYDDNYKKFWRGYNTGTGTFSDTGPALGAELWAYVPYNLLPHLKCLTDPGYNHKYFVDLKPRVFDVQIFDSSPNTLGHVEGWGTIMVVGMRFGGYRITAQEIISEVSATAYTDDRVFTSAYMVFDVSDPENPPRLLGEMTYDPGSSVDLAYTAAVPAVVPIKTSEDGSDWYLILGSGPTDVTGLSTQHAKIGMFPLNLFDSTPPQAFRIPNNSTIDYATAGSFDLGSSPNGFVSDTVTVDYDLYDLYKADVVYFGTIEGTWGGWGGKLYRWVTNEGDPQDWSTPAVMIDVGRPVTAAPSIGTDGTFFWVYFGTGRFFDIKDKSDASSNAQEYFYGIKEPVDADTGDFTWAPVDNTFSTTKPAAGNDAGSRTLLQVDGIEVQEAITPYASTLNCKTGASGCLPSDVGTFADLRDYIVGTCDPTNGCTGTDGWVLALEEDRERNLGQGALLGGLMTFTTYQPFADICKPEGEAFLYGVYYQTGTAYYEAVFTTLSNGGTYTGSTGNTVVTTRLAIGRGLATTPNLHVGRQEGSKAFVQTSTGTIVEIPQPNLPIKTTKSGRLNWRDTCP